MDFHIYCSVPAENVQNENQNRDLQSVTKHSGQNIKTKYKSNVFAPRTPLSMLMGNLWAKNISY